MTWGLIHLITIVLLVLAAFFGAGFATGWFVRGRS